jgi:hypothetical protein
MNPATGSVFAFFSAGVQYRVTSSMERIAKGSRKFTSRSMSSWRTSSSPTE